MLFRSKLSLLYFIYEERKQCIFCENKYLIDILPKNYETFLNLGMYECIPESYYMPYNISVCLNCYSAQNKYIGNLSIVYGKNHIDNFGTTKTKKHMMFSEFILNNKNIKSIVEVGSCTDTLASLIKEQNENIKYSIIEPSYSGNKTDLNIIQEYFENYDLNLLDVDTIIMSDVYEHFYYPVKILEKLQNSSIKYIYLNHPDFDYSIKNNFFINLNSEHTFLIEHQFLFELFEKYGFKLQRRVDFENFSLYLEFVRYEKNVTISNFVLKNINTYNDVILYTNNMLTIVNKINNYMDNNQNKKFYIWPSSIHSMPLFIFGLNYKNMTGI